MLVLSRKPNESIIIGDEIEITVLEVQGDVVRLGVKAPRFFRVFRREVYETIREENRQAALSLPNPDRIDRLLLNVSKSVKKQESDA